MVASAVAEQFYLGFRHPQVMRAMNANVKLRKSRQLSPETAPNVLVIDVGGTHMKVYPVGRRQPIKIDSGPAHFNLISSLTRRPVQTATKTMLA